MKEGSIVSGRYRVERRIGEGGMGSVWTAVHLVTRKRVALKMLHRQSHAQRFLREARAACAVEHENVVTVMDFLEEDGTAVMVMELLDGETLRERLDRVGCLDVDETLAVMVPVMDAVATAHAAGVVHRDLKPENIFITRAGTPKVLDFGIAMLKDDEARLTPSGAMMGTVRYMSPEQASAERAITDHRTDIWALGVMLYECLAGEGPVPGETAGVVIANLLTKTITPIAERVAGVPPELALAVDGMLAREPGDRPGDLGEVLATLGRAPRSYKSGRNRSDETVTYDGDGSSPSSRNVIRSDRSAVGYALTETPVETHAPLPRARSSRMTWAIGGIAVIGGGVVYLAAAAGGGSAQARRSEASIIAAEPAPSIVAAAPSTDASPQVALSTEPESAPPQPRRGPAPPSIQPAPSSAPSAPVASTVPPPPPPPAPRGPRGIEDKPPF